MVIAAIGIWVKCKILDNLIAQPLNLMKRRKINMDIWVLTAWDDVGVLRNEVMSILFDKKLVMPKIVELFEEDTSIYLVRVEVWNREDGTWDASYCNAKKFHRGDVVG